MRSRQSALYTCDKQPKPRLLVGLLHVWLIFCLVFVGLLPPPSAQALTASQFRIRMVTDPLLISDSNGCSSGDGPQAAYVGFKIENISGGTLSNLSVNLGDFDTGFSLAGGQAATQYIGTLAAGESDIVYWYVSYPCHTAVDHEDTLTVTLTDGGATAAYAYSSAVAHDPTTTENITTTIQSVNTISANAGGLYQAAVLGPGAVIGQIIPYDVTYSFGGVAVGDRYNLQPSGEINFNAGCFQLVNTEILSSQATAIAAGTTDDLFYYASTRQSGSGYEVDVRYYFQYLCNGVATSALPYASQTSGSTNVKYAESGYVAANSISFPPATNAFQVSKSASPTVLPNGGTVTYTVLITNTSTFNTSISSIHDVLPAGVSYVAQQASSSFEIINRSSTQPAPGATGTIQWQGGKPSTFPYDSYYVPAGTALKLVYTANVPSTVADYTNTVTPYVSTAAIGSASSTVSVGNADLEVAKTASTLTPNVGSNVTFTIQVTNNGPSTATNVVVNDVLPAGLTFETANPPADYNSTTGVWTVGTLASGASVTLSIVAKVTQATAITNSATVSSSITDLTPANNTSSVTITGQQADLAVSKSVDKTNAAIGTQVVFTVQVHNNGPSSTSGVIINDLLPTGLGYVSSNPNQGSYNQTSGEWTVGSLANGATATITITAIVNQAGALNNTANVGASDRPDPNSANNTSSAGVNGEQADLALTKIVDNATPNVGTNVSFTIQVTNNGPSTATNVVINDSLPAGLSFFSATPSADYNSTTGDWTVASLANGASATLTIVATVTQPGAITNSILVTTADQQDPLSANNTASVTVTGQQADLVLTKTVSSDTPNVNTDVSFTIQVTNNGPSTATSVVVTDMLPAGLSFVSASPAAAYDSGTGVWTVGTLVNGASATLSIVAKVTQAGAITNTVTSSAAQPDPVPANNTSSVLVTGQQADLSILKSVNNTMPNVDDQVIFTIELSNQGPSTANNVSVSEILPAGLSLASASPSQGVYNASSGLWELTALGSGSNATLTIVANVLTVGPKTNTVAVSSSQPDPNPSDNTSSVIVSGQQVDLAIEKTVSDATPHVGSNVTFTIKVTNNGPSSATGVSVSDLLPSGLTFVSANPSEG